MWDWFKPEEVKPFVDHNGETTYEGQKRFGEWERQERPAPQAPQQPWETYDAYLLRINS